MAQSYDEAYGSLANVYDPQTSLVNTQLAALPGEYAPQYSALDQAKVNAFRSIDESANAKGMLFSGFSPDQQAQYVGTKYLPAVASLKSQQQQRTFSLQDQLNKINAARSSQAQGSVAEQQKAELDAQRYAQDMAFKQAQLSLGYAKLGASQSAAANKPLTKEQAASAIRQGLINVKGNDGHVSPYDLAGAYKDWTGLGLAPNDFWKNYQGYWNNKQSNYGQIFYSQVNKR